MKIILIGYGAMNQRVARLAEEKGHEVEGVIVRDSSKTYPYPTFERISDAKDADVAIDFSNPELLLPLLDDEFKLPLVIATTGEKEEIVEKLKELSSKMPVFFSANMSYGVHALTKILEAAVPLLQDFDIELTEAHHNKKVDAPSGTLVKLYDVIESLRDKTTPVYDRHETNAKRTQDEIGIHSVRGGTIVGQHDVLFAGTDETIEITHRAQSKDIFANGSIGAAEKLIHKSNDFYTFDNL
ncbi:MULTISPECIES: 4-hydroxy-tetrahydrodipicolinate reductase [Staphylococcus]|jgi:4-hydroxy-tetrahydrodipicolinate reductase|uniref:4-hydroxy-tetrahydrodipicolinate reductase n=1 Tax=Staphylococcus nepalensis TaxID=214473 RepID=A0ABS3KX53_9STAP|nr:MULTISPECIES: 4-hydroxy-tetrahydrodipicolinate reductase [Staphylococcus]MBO1204913.1 4-hydroxy-tetrahydrodipicolinate reductase [Staphylococcus nepalensis]MBO1213541.1 4-hydroxy-tetrahydrodipicolinate reductase [Staphylococcus nepalensis]MBO1215237.1 4-hydroxy-tetrahydrodipicolinate reductase [Staphylococcus nepalensis]MBO1225879.1 4-hydroxy-tetrahydrodipicolinate reductase [Staphylococcus nepalensis]MBO1234307.1 4-hydroxy-tetrahydrodipicolinate reductase [Staphylococcus nepalensis]